MSKRLKEDWRKAIEEAAAEEARAEIDQILKEAWEKGPQDLSRYHAQRWESVPQSRKDDIFTKIYLQQDGEFERIKQKIFNLAVDRLKDNPHAWEESKD